MKLKRAAVLLTASALVAVCLAGCMFADNPAVKAAKTPDFKDFVGTYEAYGISSDGSDFELTPQGRAFLRFRLPSGKESGDLIAQFRTSGAQWSDSAVLFYTGSEAAEGYYYYIFKDSSTSDSEFGFFPEGPYTGSMEVLFATNDGYLYFKRIATS